MQRERQNKQNKPDEEKKEGYIIVTNYFLKKWVKVLGVGSVVLYQELLTYCHKGKYIAWPTINSLCQQMGIAKTTLLRYQDTLIKFGLIKNITRGKSTTGHYRNNIYQITPLEELSEPPDPGKIIDFLGSKMKPDRYQNDTCIGSNMKLSLVSNRYPNNNNLKHYQGNNNKEGENAVVVAVNFKKLKEKGEEKVLAIKEQLLDLDFKESFIEKLLKDYSSKKIEEKIELLKFKRNIQNPAGWLSAALKNDYQDPDRENSVEESPSLLKMDSRFHGNDIGGSIHQTRQESPRQINPSLTKNINTPEQASHPSTENKKILSREEALKQIRLARHRLDAITPSYQMEGRWQKKKGEDICQN